METRKAGSYESWKWESTGDGTYTIDDGARETNGTTITLHMKPAGKDDDGEELKDYLSEWTIRSIIKEYSDFVTYPIYVKDTEDDKNDEKEEPVNSMKALWTRPQKDITDDEFNEFYRHISHDWEGPARTHILQGRGRKRVPRAALHSRRARRWTSSIRTASTACSSTSAAYS